MDIETGRQIGAEPCRQRKGWGIEKDRKEEREAVWEQEGTERES